MKVSKSSWRNGRLQARLAASISVRFAFIHVEAKLLGYVEAKLLGLRSKYIEMREGL